MYVLIKADYCQSSDAYISIIKSEASLVAILHDLVALAVHQGKDNQPGQNLYLIMVLEFIKKIGNFRYPNRYLLIFSRYPPFDVSL